ncbi:hypothetical protein [Streptomyces sp. AN091965]|uniref:hypothetical protein n=1 Tax=Streptomyces sp. AN091965 TaxID=2927803 RepID=UPI001F6062B2|nr:hypothetical protein [Streptomyces sp. AN091965]MCI3929970.1 hypothetical protein [Streptomyces sp. AN091965]
MRAAVRAQLPWLPPVGVVWHVEAGVDFDAVRTPRTLGLRIIATLGSECGAVICDPWTRIHYFLVAPGATGGWRLPQTVACGRATYIVVPPLGASEPSLHWTVEPSAARVHTNVDRLRRTVQHVLNTHWREDRDHHAE